LRSAHLKATDRTISPQAVIDAGATGFISLNCDPILISKIRDAYTVAISNTMILLLVTICVSIPVAFGMKWLNIKGVSIERERERAVLENRTVFAENQDERAGEGENRVAEK
jgi:hypothetical protein